MKSRDMSRATSFKRAGTFDGAPTRTAILTHSDRHVRRKLLELSDGDVLVDLPNTIALRDGDVLVLEDGGLIGIEAADEPLLEVIGKDPKHLLTLAWYLGNRHLPAQIEDGRILIQRDHVMERMLDALGAAVRKVSEPFSPEHGAYHNHSHD